LFFIVASCALSYLPPFPTRRSSDLSSTDTSTFGSAISDIPEIPWNDSCAGMLLANYEGYSTTYGHSGFCSSFLGGYFQSTASGGGGPSGCTTGTPTVSGVVSGTCQGWPKPPWQSVVGNPSDAVRDTPDISLFAADGLWNHYYVFCWSDTAHGGASCTGAPSGWSGGGRTSFASPIMAGIQALVNQKTGERLANAIQLSSTKHHQSAHREFDSRSAKRDLHSDSLEQNECGADERNRYGDRDSTFGSDSRIDDGSGLDMCSEQLHAQRRIERRGELSANHGYGECCGQREFAAGEPGKLIGQWIGKCVRQRLYNDYAAARGCDLRGRG